MFRSNWNLEVSVFVEEGKPDNPEKNPRSKVRNNNKLKPQEMARTGIGPGSQRWEVSAYPLHRTCSKKILQRLKSRASHLSFFICSYKWVHNSREHFH